MSHIGQFVVELPFEESLRNSLRSDHPFVTVNDVNYSVLRLNSFAIHGCNCCRCGVVGDRIIAHIPGDGVIHVDLYGRGKRGGWLLMTRDHIVPYSKGGRNNWRNYQTMCSQCNNKKGDHVSEEDLKLSKFRKHWGSIHTRFQNRLHYFGRQKRFYSGLARWVCDHRYLHRLTYAIAKISS